MTEKIISDILLYAAGILWGVELIPQIMQTIKTRCVRDLNLVFFIICLVAYVLSVIGNGIVNNWVIVYASIPSLIGNIIMVALILKYRKN
jgi:uncharacterized protein with PQ loop repeat